MNSYNFSPLNSYSPELASEHASALEGSSILVTGGMGLVGLSSLAYLEYLRNNHGLKVRITLSAKSGQGVQLAHSFGSDFEFLMGDLGDFSFIETVGEYDHIIHAAGYGQPSRFLANKYSTLRISSLATLELRKKSKQSFLFVSSSEIYSGLEHESILESEIGGTTPSHLRAAYIEGKRFGECATLLGNSEGMSVGSVARLSLAYGPGTRLDDQRVLSELIVRGLTEGKVNLKDSGSRLRSYCYSEDSAEMLFGVLLQGKGETYNVAGKSAISIRGLGERIAQQLNVPFSAPDHDPGFDSSPQNVSLNISKVTQLLGKKRFISFDDGLNKTIEWYRSLL